MKFNASEFDKFIEIYDFINDNCKFIITSFNKKDSSALRMFKSFTIYGIQRDHISIEYSNVSSSGVISESVMTIPLSVVVFESGEAVQWIEQNNIEM